MDNKCPCSTGSDRPSNPILFNILSQMDTSEPGQRSLSYTSMPHRCNCEQRRTVCLKTPSEFSLLRSCWAPLFILGLAQERVDFEVTDTPADSMLKRILLNRQESPRAEKEQPTLAGVSKLRSCLKKFWSLDLSPKEYAYLKGTAIFNPDVPDLKAALFVESLQQEAQHALREVVLLLHQEDHERFARILLTASMLQSITPSLISELFFRPVIGQADLLELMVDMLFFR
ncbi:nuclear receptor subfamily 0 group B member 2a isoform X3 [Takifugu flavidus]|uniref:nuclear receptor subfamily 0 group B member 2a isoform X3 n=1 Tax=Takifugu flavidus TaxID=433684 RepID=UPI002544C7E9|nr:nuclear receptor subfamily 0 group B member 2a isoform X3 [Takifugu flavidus]